MIVIIPPTNAFVGGMITMDIFNLFCYITIVILNVHYITSDIIGTLVGSAGVC
jgi:hypothetical protein